jgi:hypothetical protein
MSDLSGKVGFASPASANKLITRRRAGIELIATFGLAISLFIAMTAVSIGAAHAQVLRAVGHDGDASLAIAALIALVIAGLAGWAAALPRRSATAGARGTANKIRRRLLPNCWANRRENRQPSA